MQHTSGYSLFKRGNRYYIEYTDTKGHRKQKSTGCTVKADALKVLSDLKTLTRPGNHSKLFSVFKAEFLTYAEGTFAATTVRMYASALSNFERLIGDLPLAAVTTAQADLYKTKRKKEERRNRFKSQGRSVSHRSPLISSFGH